MPPLGSLAGSKLSIKPISRRVNHQDIAVEGRFSGIFVKLRREHPLLKIYAREHQLKRFAWFFFGLFLGVVAGAELVACIRFQFCYRPWPGGVALVGRIVNDQSKCT